MWQVDVTGRNNIEYKNIYLGKDRLLTKMGNETYHNASDNSYQRINQYYNHANHIGSVNVVSDYQGKEFKYVEYTPYGEEWFSETSNLNSGAVGPDGLEYGFTDHLHDEETGLLYANARYLDPKTSRWMSSDPAMADGLNWYRYANNNPIKYKDPTGLITEDGIIEGGDTLGEIANEWGSDIESIMAVNPQIRDPDKIYAGDQLNRPETIEDSQGEQSNAKRAREPNHHYPSISFVSNRIDRIHEISSSSGSSNSPVSQSTWDSYWSKNIGDDLTPEEQQLQNMILDVLIMAIGGLAFLLSYEEGALGISLSAMVPPLAIGFGILAGSAMLATNIYAMYTMNSLSKLKGSTQKVLDKGKILELLATVGISGLEELYIILKEDKIYDEK
ncbi:LysM peptidoglycan-binding domain-containing protein [Entomospira entomophila]|uniref:LysM peptidoglycan-binding domain-containing protein n=1 Tax=Entomospira entomophila TaxID=2719988 RepID=A0A968GAQ3_9SPIO|nr:RHS repeat-associated core domain-containing protein [Entomospira entomophilus]NIZ41047.1 LysM peptidoglycan-binding domain-containing protein [Entomospira entomophilus]WDI35256.1 LysM peptidoglycan-binding domain-containing protein [Entomospira entomophilus]